MISVIILNENNYLNSMEDIIQRDFFTHIPYLQSKLEWLEAIRSKNKKHIYKAQHNIAARLSYHQIFNIKAINDVVSIPVKKNKRKGIYILSSMLLDEFCTIYGGKNNENIVKKT